MNYFPLSKFCFLAVLNVAINSVCIIKGGDEEYSHESKHLGALSSNLNSRVP